MKLLAAFPAEQVPAAVQTHKTSAELPASYLVDPLMGKIKNTYEKAAEDYLVCAAIEYMTGVNQNALDIRASHRRLPSAK